MKRWKERKIKIKETLKEETDRKEEIWKGKKERKKANQ